MTPSSLNCYKEIPDGKSLFLLKARFGSFFNFGKLGSTRLASAKARLGSARQKVGSGATLVTPF